METSMKHLYLTSFFSLSMMAGCATTGPTPAGMQPGKFVAYSCDAGKRLQARLADDGKSIRIRYEGGYELDSKGNGVYETDGWTLDTTAKSGFTLAHKGKQTLKNCKPA
jgi:hypothetical protein